MIRLAEALGAWGTEHFEQTLKREIERIGAEHLPLQEGLSRSSYAVGDKLSVLINNVSDSQGVIRVTAGILYTGIIAGCSCADDPTPVDENTEYCEVRLEIDKKTAETTLVLLHE